MQLENATLHDVGCGICDLYHYVSGRYDSLVYSGTEIVPEMVTLARSKYPELDIFQRNIINDTVLIVMTMLSNQVSLISRVIRILSRGEDLHDHLFHKCFKCPQRPYLLTF